MLKKESVYQFLIWREFGKKETFHMWGFGENIAEAKFENILLRTTKQREHIEHIQAIPIIKKKDNSAILLDRKSKCCISQLNKVDI